MNWKCSFGAFTTNHDKQRLATSRTKEGMLHHDPKHFNHSEYTPHVTIERYSELTGLPVDTINDMLADGRIPRHRLRKDKKREKVMINRASLTVDALSVLETFAYRSQF